MSDRKPPEPIRPMSDQDFLKTVSNLVSSAKSYAKNTRVEREREVTLRYYFGEPYGDETVERSSFITQDVMETVTWLLPPIKKKFLWSNRPVEFANTHDTHDMGGDAISNFIAGKVSEEQSEDATEYVGHVFYRENEGYKVLSDVIWDAAVSKTGIMQHQYKEWTEQTSHRFFNLDEAQVDALMAQDMPDGVTANYEVDERRPMLDDMGNPVIGPNGEPVEVVDVTVTRTQEMHGTVVSSVPPEDAFVVAGDLYIWEGMQGFFHRIKRPRFEWLDEGFDEDCVRDMPAETVETEELKITRQGRSTTAVSNVDAWQQEVTGWQCFVRVDKDGDGTHELIRVTMAGEGIEYIMTKDGEPDYEVVNEIPYTDFCLMRIPHAFYGECPADRVANLQLLSTTVMRSTMDYFYEVNTPTVVVGQGGEREDGSTLRDLVERSPGSYVRAEDATQLRIGDRPPDMSPLALQLNQWIDDKVVTRTGSMKMAPASDPNSLQPGSATEVMDRRTTHDEIIDDMAGSIADSLRRVFLQILKTESRYADKPKTIMVKDRWKTIDPRHFPTDMGIKVNVGLGSGITEKRTQQLVALTQKQTELIAQFGFADDNPGQGFVTRNQYYNTCQDLVKAMGLDESSRYFSDPTGKGEFQVPPQILAQIEAQAMQKAQESVLVQLEKYKVDKDTQTKVQVAMLQAQQRDTESERETAQKERDSQRDAETEVYTTNVKEATKRQEIAADIATGSVVNISG